MNLDTRTNWRATVDAVVTALKDIYHVEAGVREIRRLRPGRFNAEITVQLDPDRPMLGGWAVLSKLIDHRGMRRRRRTQLRSRSTSILASALAARGVLALTCRMDLILLGRLE